MIKISKTEFDYMIENGILRCFRGKYKGLLTGSKFKSGRAKARWVEENIYRRMMEFKRKQR